MQQLGKGLVKKSVMTVMSALLISINLQYLQSKSNYNEEHFTRRLPCLFKHVFKIAKSEL